MSAASPLARRALHALAIAALALGSACTDETIVFRDREPFNPPPDAASGFLGYFTVADKLTTCGNCHVGQQAGWVGTAHAGAYGTLTALPAGVAQDFCFGCHTVNERGNALVDPAGWSVVQDSAYQDVQCENCHGPGLTHVENPDATQPLASALVGIALTDGCGDCHQGTHHPFVDEWAQSPHASPFGEFFPGAGGENCTSCAAANPSCQGCHRGQGILKRFGENANYIEKEAAAHLPITCAVCHDPHDATNEHQLRFPVNTTSIEEHLCAQCHNRRTAPVATSEHGLEPHAPEAALLVGDAGWFAPGADISPGQIRATHGSAGNPELCATCHLSAFTVTDPASGDHVFSATGHLFRPIPCLDPQGIPLPFANDCGFTTAERSYQSCTASGCHFDPTAAFSALIAATTRIQQRADELESQLLQVDPNLADPGGEIDPTVGTFTVAEGAFFNHELATFGNEDFGTNTVVGSSVHNPFLVEALLIASIQAMQAQYGVNPAPPADPATDWNAELEAVLQRVRQ